MTENTVEKRPFISRKPGNFHNFRLSKSCLRKSNQRKNPPYSFFAQIALDSLQNTLEKLFDALRLKVIIDLFIQLFMTAESYEFVEQDPQHKGIFAPRIIDNAFHSFIGKFLSIYFKIFPD